MIKSNFRWLSVLVLATITVACASARNTIAKGDNEKDVFLFPVKEDGIFFLNKDFDMKGKTYVIPQNATIRQKRGVIKNGTLIGQNTKLDVKMPVFLNVTIKGEWDVPIIHTNLFVDLNYDNSLRDVFALANPTVNNSVVIERGVYYVTVENNEGVGICVNDNTDLVINGTINLRPNCFSNYDIVLVKGKNIVITGTGSIIGDRFEHLGTSGEWGIGIDVSYSESVIIDGITVKNCWGDCIYVGDNSRDIKIRNCVLTSSRRQGISVTSGEHIEISRCYISNISGTNPQYAIDLEPNCGDTVQDVKIESIVSDNCIGGIQVWGNAEKAVIKDVIIENSVIKNSTSRYPIRIYKAENVVISQCDIDSDGDYAALTQYVKGLTVFNSTMKAIGKKPLNILQCQEVNTKGNTFVKK